PYNILDFRTDYQLDQLKLYLKILNLLDRKYEVSEAYYSFPLGEYYIPGPGRTWEIGLNYAF
ncbi:MAG: TonB-dependent receptor, partial [Candidatus Margulisbacteria bacterium]|nr:TonB-dependent receptor [Candidatus Margulisiibacteriota bacterium]